MRKRIICALLCAILLLPLTSCGMKKYTRTDVTLFDTETVITGYCSSESDFNKKADEIIKYLTDYHKLYDIYNEYEGMTNLRTVNLSAGKTVKVDDRIIDLIVFGKNMYKLTGGYTNIAIGSVTKIWHEYREAGTAVPAFEDLRLAAKHTKIDDVTYDRGAGTVTLLDPEMSLDVGAVAKGYAAEMAARMIKRNGWDSIALSVGGNVRCVGKKDDGKKWTTGIQNPGVETLASVVAEVELEDSACVTSGSYQRYYEVDGVRYHHIINPESLFPENDYLSVSVVCDDSGIADALSTALFNMSEKKGRAILDEAGADAIWVYPDGKITRTKGAE